MQCNICGNEMRVFAKGKSWTYFKCNKCHWYSTQKNFEEISDADYDEYETFDQSDIKFNEYVKEASKILKYKFDLIGAKPKSFLDIGCSEGVWVKAYSEICEGKSSGIEVAKPKIKRAREKGLDVGEFDTIADKYEFVLLRHVIEHISNPREYVEMILNKYVIGGGYLFIETPNNDNWDHIKNGNSIREDRFCRELYPPTHVCGFTPKTFKRWKDIDVVYETTFSWGDRRWFYDVNDSSDMSNNIKNALLTALSINGNIAAVIRNK